MSDNFSIKFVLMFYRNRGGYFVCELKCGGIPFLSVICTCKHDSVLWFVSVVESA